MGLTKAIKLLRVIFSVVFVTAAMFPAPVMAQDLGMLPSDFGRFSVGAGLYQAPDEAISDSGVYSFVRYEISSFEFEIDYGVSDQSFFLGAADYIYHVPTASGITQTEVAIGAGVTFVNNDPSIDDSKFGMNVLGQVRFMDSFAVQVRRDFLGDNANLWTFGLSYSFF